MKTTELNSSDQLATLDETGQLLRPRSSDSFDFAENDLSSGWVK